MCYLCLIYMYYFKHISFLRRVRLNIIRSITHSYLLWCEYNSGRHLLLKNVLMLFITSMDNDRGYRYCNMRNNLYLNFASRIIVIWQRLCFSRPDIIFSRLAAMYNMTALVEAFFLLPRQKKKKKLPVCVYHTIKYLTWMNNAASWKLLCDKNKRSRTRKRRRDINGVM